MKKHFLILFVLFGSFNLFAQADYYYAAKKIDSTGTESYWLHNSIGELVFEESYDWFHVNVWGWIFTFRNDTIDAYNSSAVPFDIEGIEDIHHVWNKTTLIPLKIDGKWGYFTIEGLEKINPKFDDITLFKDGKAAVSIDEEYFYIDESGARLNEQYLENTDYEFQNLSQAYGLTGWLNRLQEKFEENGFFGLREVATGKHLLPAIYDNLYNLQKTQVTAKLNRMFGVVDFENTIVIPFHYDEIIVLD